MAATDATSPALPDGLKARRLATGDIEAVCALSAEAGWNQTAADWSYMTQSGRGLAVEDDTGRIGASAMLLPYGGRYGWIAMILVTRAWQRQGIANVLMRRCIADCEATGLIPGLDATEQGRPVYLPLGFQDIYELNRMVGQGFGRSMAEKPGSLRPMGDGDLDAVAAFDRAACGADRGALLRHLFSRRPELSTVVERDGRLAGYLLARDGRLATQLGPLVADDEVVARDLLIAALGDCPGQVLLDIGQRHAGLLAYLESVGFQRQRGYTRMLLGRSEPLDDPSRVIMIAGPEFG